MQYKLCKSDMVFYSSPHPFLLARVHLFTRVLRHLWMKALAKLELMLILLFATIWYLCSTGGPFPVVLFAVRSPTVLLTDTVDVEWLPASFPPLLGPVQGAYAG